MAWFPPPPTSSIQCKVISPWGATSPHKVWRDFTGVQWKFLFFTSLSDVSFNLLSNIVKMTIDKCYYTLLPIKFTVKSRHQTMVFMHKLSYLWAQPLHCLFRIRIRWNTEGALVRCKHRVTEQSSRFEALLQQGVIVLIFELHRIVNGA